jgi:hypothetical protein
MLRYILFAREDPKAAGKEFIVSEQSLVIGKGVIIIKVDINLCYK